MTTKKFTRKQKDRLYEALEGRSEYGKFEQGRGSLCTVYGPKETARTTFCCLGVELHVNVKTPWRDRATHSYPHNLEHGLPSSRFESKDQLPPKSRWKLWDNSYDIDKLASELNLAPSFSSQEYSNVVSVLATANDKGVSFKKISSALRKSEK